MNTNDVLNKWSNAQRDGGEREWVVRVLQDFSQVQMFGALIGDVFPKPVDREWWREAIDENNEMVPFEPPFDGSNPNARMETRWEFDSETTALHWRAVAHALAVENGMFLTVDLFGPDVFDDCDYDRDREPTPIRPAVKIGEKIDP